MNVRKLIVILFGFLCYFSISLWADVILVIKFPAAEVGGRGPYPYNYRIIDNHIHAGGHPMNPTNNFGNTDEQTESILKYLISKDVKTVIDLENTRSIQKRYQLLLDKQGIKRIHIPMHYIKTPNKAEWQQIMTAFEQPVYIHCKWGADRTGAIIGRYLVEVKGYTSAEAYRAVISNGSHAGVIGGLKTSPYYRQLKQFIYEEPRKGNL
ncbi:MAG: dual specificity protein phosphatase family protein [Patescibacteria group bacterium]